VPYRIIYEVGGLAVDGWAVTFGTAMRGAAGCGLAQSPPYLYLYPLGWHTLPSHANAEARLTGWPNS